MDMDVDGLLERIEQGMTTADDAVVMARCVARMLCYERTLREIVAHGDGEWRAMRALLEDWKDDGDGY